MAEASENSDLQGELVKRDERILLGTQDPEWWQKTLCPSVTSITLLGQLTLVSLSEDFSLMKNRPQKGFEFIKQPESYRATLYQVCTEAYNAYQAAGVSMEKIHKLSSQIPKIAKLELDVIINCSKEEREAIIPTYNKQILEKFKKCKEHASENVKNFGNVMNLVDEISRVCIAKSSHQDEEMHRSVQKSLSKQFEKSIVDQQVEEAKDEKEKLQKEMEKVKTEYLKAVDQMVDEATIVWLAKGFARLPVCTMIISLISHSPIELINEAMAYIEQFEVPDVIARQREIICRCLREINNLLKSKGNNKVDWEAICKSQKGPTFYATFFRSIIEKIDEKDLFICKQYSRLLASAIDLCEKMLKVARDLRHTTSEVDALQNHANKLLDTGMTLKRAVDKQLERAGTTKPRFWPTQVEERRDRLNRLEKHYDELSNRVAQCSREQVQIFEEMSQLDVTKIDFEQIKEILSNGMETLRLVRMKWAKLVAFFDSVFNLVNEELSDQLTIFSDHASIFSHRPTISDTIKRHFQQEHATGVFTAARNVEEFSSVYVEVSKKYLSGCLAELGNLITLKAETAKDKETIMEKQKKIHMDCQMAHIGIQTIIEDRINQHKRLAMIEESPSDQSVGTGEYQDIDATS